MSQAECNLQKWTQPLFKAFLKAATMQTILEAAVKIITKVMTAASKRYLQPVIQGLGGIKAAISVAQDNLTPLSYLLHGMIRNGKGDEHVSESHLAIIESGRLVPLYKDSNDLEGVDEVTKRLHRISFLVHCCASDEIYKLKFGVIVEEEIVEEDSMEETQSNKRQKVEELV